MTKTTDGFKISEEDFKLRGSGDLFGVRQSGDMNFKLADFKLDFNILIKAKEDTEYLLKNNINDFLRLSSIRGNFFNITPQATATINPYATSASISPNKNT